VRKKIIPCHTDISNLEDNLIQFGRPFAMLARWQPPVNPEQYSALCQLHKITKFHMQHSSENE